MKILLVYPKFKKYLETNPEILKSVGGDKIHYAAAIYMPALGIPILTALTPKEHEIKFVDGHLDEIPYEEYFDLVAVSAFTPQAKAAYDIGDGFRAKGIKTIMGGLHAKNYPEDCSKHFDSVFVGEAETLWQQMLDDVAAGKLKPYYDGGCTFDLNNYVVPDRSLLKAKKGYDWRPLILQNIRGCKFNCAYCAITNCDGKKFRFRRVNQIIEEIQDNLDLDGMFIGDDQYLVPDPEMEKFAFEFFSELKNINYKKHILLTAEPLLTKNRKLLKLIRESGVNTLYFVMGWDPVGIRALSYNEPQEAEESIKILQDEGFNLFGSIGVGQDCDTPDIFPRTIEFLERNNITQSEFWIQTPFPGTPAWRKYKKQGRILTENFDLYNGAHVVYQPKKMTKEQLEEGFLYLWKEFYKRNKLEPEELLDYYYLSDEYKEKVGVTDDKKSQEKN